MYMRLLGYSASKIAILTTYNGQRDLIECVGAVVSVRGDGAALTAPRIACDFRAVFCGGSRTGTW